MIGYSRGANTVGIVPVPMPGCGNDPPPSRIVTITLGIGAFEVARGHGSGQYEASNPKPHSSAPWPPWNSREELNVNRPVVDDEGCTGFSDTDFDSEIVSAL